MPKSVVKETQETQPEQTKPGTHLALVPQGQTALASWENQTDLIMRTVAPGLSKDEFQLFCYVAKVRHLDPLQRQIHAVKRSTWMPEQQTWVEKMTIQTGIDGYRAIANRTGLYMPSDKLPLLEDIGKTEMRATVWVKKYHPGSHEWHEFGATAYYREFVQFRKNKDTQKYEPNSMWAKMPNSQLIKCAEALALRRGWPEELGGIYVDDEMTMPDGPPEIQPPTKPSQQAKTSSTGKLKPSAEPNRGHGNEGMQRNEPIICNECRVTDGHTPECPQNPANKKDRRETWKSYPGHDPKTHITFDQGITLFKLQSDLGITEQQIKAFLDKEYEIQHRPLIPKDRFDEICKAITERVGEIIQKTPPKETLFGE
jgi:phage recombination protein Bet